MKRLLEILTGVGSALSAFGTRPSYFIPHRGSMSADFAAVGDDLRDVLGGIEIQAGY
ncbi:MAG: hypothetical protein VB131_08935 [Burkholderia gladioli]